ncbi:MAG TPA: hypothetical protein VF614_13120 [Chthoniobacteraceae bacterium]
MNDTNKTSTRRAILLVAALAAVACIVVPGYALHRKASLTAEESGQRALLAEVRKQLSIYHHDHGSYPRSLSQLQVTTFADGSTPETLRQFRYESNGSTYTLGCYGVASRETIIIQPTP